MSEKQRDVKEIAAEICEQFLFKLTVGQCSYSQVEESIVRGLQTERDRAERAESKVAACLSFLETAGYEIRLLEEMTALRTRAEQAEAELTRIKQLNTEQTHRLMKAEHDLAEAVEALKPFADKGNRISGNETCTV